MKSLCFPAVSQLAINVFTYKQIQHFKYTEHLYKYDKGRVPDLLLFWTVLLLAPRWNETSALQNVEQYDETADVLKDKNTVFALLKNTSNNLSFISPLDTRLTLPASDILLYTQNVRADALFFPHHFLCCTRETSSSCGGKREHVLECQRDSDLLRSRLTVTETE